MLIHFFASAECLRIFAWRMDELYDKNLPTSSSFQYDEDAGVEFLKDYKCALKIFG